jgi:hypothetical protein
MMIGNADDGNDDDDCSSVLAESSPRFLAWLNNCRERIIMQWIEDVKVERLYNVF